MFSLPTTGTELSHGICHVNCKANIASVPWWKEEISQEQWKTSSLAGYRTPPSTWTPVSAMSCPSFSRTGLSTFQVAGGCTLCRPPGCCYTLWAPFPTTAVHTPRLTICFLSCTALSCPIRQMQKTAAEGENCSWSDRGSSGRAGAPGRQFNLSWLAHGPQDTNWTTLL